MNQLSQYLEIIHPDGKEQIVNLQNAAIKIGRAAGNDIVLSDDMVSQWHCIITPSEEGYWSIRDGIIDRGGSYRCSTNGTFLKRNNQIIDIRSSSDCKEFLSGDDEIQIRGCQIWQIIFKDLFKTDNGKIGDTIKNVTRDEIQDGYVFCKGQKKLFLVNQGKRALIQLTPNQFKLIMGLAQRNRDYGKPVLCTREEIIWLIWGENYHGNADIPSYVSDLRKKLGFDSIETVAGEGLILNIDITYED